MQESECQQAPLRRVSADGLDMVFLICSGWREAEFITVRPPKSQAWVSNSLIILFFPSTPHSYP